jgi:hypothetical protein
MLSDWSLSEIRHWRRSKHVKASADVAPTVPHLGAPIRDTLALASDRRWVADGDVVTIYSGDGEGPNDGEVRATERCGGFRCRLAR